MITRKQSVSNTSMSKVNLDVESFTNTMKHLICDALKPVNENIVALGAKFDNVQSALEIVTETANRAISVADTAKSLAESVDHRVTKLEAALDESLSKQKQLYEQTLRMESYSRRDNLRFDGVSEVNGEVCLSVLQGVLSKMNPEFGSIPIAKVHRIGRYCNNQSKPQIIIAKFVRPVDRAMIWASRSTLKGTGVWLKEDYPAEYEKRRNTLWPYLRAARAGNPSKPDQRIKAYMRDDKLVINTQSYNINQLDRLSDFVQAQAHQVKQHKVIFSSL